MWNTTDYKGNPVTWYSQDEIDWLMKKLDDAYKCRDDCELHWEKEKNILKDKIIDLNTKLYLETVGHNMAKAERIDAQKKGKKYKFALKEIKKTVFQAEQKLHCCY